MNHIVDNFVLCNVAHYNKRPANKNKVPNQVLFTRYVKVGMILAPFIIWLIWAN